MIFSTLSIISIVDFNRYMSSKENAQEEEDEENEILYCNFCSKKAVFHCGNCYAVAYCSLDHQKNDRPSHKIHCKSP